MFRNGFNATRRSFFTIAHSRPLPLPKKDHFSNGSGSFVCVSCQFRSLHSKPAKKVKRTETFLDAIKRLEAHVQHIEKTYIDKVRQQEALKELPADEITDELQDRAYAALMSPPDAAVAFLPAPATVLDRLPAPVVARLGESTALVTQKTPEWGVVLSELDKNGGLSGMSVWEVNNLVYCINVDQRAALSKRILGMMSVSGVFPDSLTLDLFMLAHAAVKEPEEVKRLFADMKERGITPTVYSYGHLLKAYFQLSDVTSATYAIQEMHSYNIIPNLVVYTTLIQTCIARNQLATAWEIFNLIKLKSTSTAPDVPTYTVMIHACALNGEVERALDLYTDMTLRRGLVPSRETYHALIHACAMRKDYFAYAWKFATEMQQQGMTINRRYLNTLIQACGRTGELTRARLLVRHMMASTRERKNVQPDEITFQNLMRAYATYRIPNFEGKKKKVAGEGGNGVKEPAFVGAGTGQLEKRVDGAAAEEKIPFLEKGVLGTNKDVLQEAKQVLGWLKSKRTWFVSTQLLNSYMDVCQNQGGFVQAKKCYDKFFSAEGPAKAETADEIGKPEESEEQVSDETAEEDEEAGNEEESTISFGSAEYDTKDREPFRNPKSRKIKTPHRNIHTFEIALQSASRSHDLLFARRIMLDRDQFKLTKTYWTMFPEEREKHEFYAERMMVNILARCEHLGEAAERVRKTWEGQQWEWKKEHLKTLFVIAVQHEDWSTVKLCQKVAGLVDKRY